MGKVPMDRTETTSAEAILKDELARGDRALRGVAPVISHLLESSGPALVSDGIVARLRGMLADLAKQLLDAASETPHHAAADPVSIDALADALAGEGALIGHLYALAMEGYLTERLEQRVSLDPVLSPLLQELIASDQAATADLAMSVLAAQTRFTQSQRRMELPIGELPSDIFLMALDVFDAAPTGLPTANVSRALTHLKRDYDEGAGRIGLLSRLVSSMHRGAIAALNLEHAGFALFTTGLAALTAQPRDLAVFSCHEAQTARLALGLRAAGLAPEAIEAQFMLLGALDAVPSAIGVMPPERAQAILVAGELGDTLLGAMA